MLSSTCALQDMPVPFPSPHAPAQLQASCHADVCLVSLARAVPCMLADKYVRAHRVARAPRLLNLPVTGALVLLASHRLTLLLTGTVACALTDAVAARAVCARTDGRFW